MSAGKILRRAAVSSLLLISPTGFAQANEVETSETPCDTPLYSVSGDEWHGTLQTTFGEIRLIQDGRRVFGEYAKRGYFEGCVHDGGASMRGTFQYFSPRSRQGFVEFRLDGNWNYMRSGVPAKGKRNRWAGARSNPDVPSEVYIRANEMSFADMWPDISAAQRRWVLGSDYYDSCDPPEVDYEGSERGDDPPSNLDDEGDRPRGEMPDLFKN